MRGAFVVFIAGALAAAGCNALIGLEPGERRGPAPAGVGGEGAGGGGISAMGGGDVAPPPKQNGASCQTGSECLSESCVSGVCCDARCNAACQSCIEPGSVGTCVLLAAGAGTCVCDSYLVSPPPGGVCDGAGRCACGAPALWAHRFGGADTDLALDVAAAGGHVVVAGHYSGEAPPGYGALDWGSCTPPPGTSNGNADAFLLATTGAPSCALFKRFGLAGTDGASGVAAVPGGGTVLVGTFSLAMPFGGPTMAVSAGAGDAFVARLAADGSEQWSHRIGGPGADAAQSVAVDGAGDAFVVAFVSGSVTTSIPSFGDTSWKTPLAEQGGSADVVVVRLGSDGKAIWGRRIGSGGYDYARAVAAQADGTSAVGGVVAAATDFGGGPTMAAGADLAFVASYDPKGDHRWARLGPAGSGVYGVGFHPGGDVLAGGSFTEEGTLGGATLTPVGKRTAFVVRLGSLEGQAAWVRSFGGTGAAVADVEDLAIDPYGNVLVAGSFTGAMVIGSYSLPSVGASEGAFVAKLAADGTVLWADGYGADMPDVQVRGTAVSADPAGNVLVAGHFLGSVSFAPQTTLTSDGSAERDAFFLLRSP
jgi:hypothetical protein